MSGYFENILSSASKSGNNGINVFDFTAQRHFVARKLPPSFIRKYIWKLWYLKADCVECSRFDEGYCCSYSLNKLLVAWWNWGNGWSHHSHKKRKDGLKTRAACTWIFILAWTFGGGQGDFASTFFKTTSGSWFWCS